MARVRLVEGDIAEAEVDAIVLGPGGVGPEGKRQIRVSVDPADIEASMATAIREALEHAEREKLSNVAFPPLGAGDGGLSMRECAEVMLSELRELAPDCELEEIQIVLSGEPTYRLFEQVQDAWRIRVQLEKLKRGRV